MSIRVMTMVWDSEAYEGGTLLVLLAMADWAADDGSSVHPKMETLAKKARMSVRGAQLCVAQLRADGVLVIVKRAMRGRATEYKIMLDVVKKMHRKECTAIPSDEPESAIGVKPDGVGVKSDVSHIDNHQSQPSEEPSNVRAKAWPSVWRAFKTWPGLPAGASEQRAREVWQRMGDNLPADIVARIQAHGAALVADNAKRGRAGHQLVTHPHNWLERDRGWEAYVPESVDHAAIDAAKDKADRYFKRGKYAEAAA